MATPEIPTGIADWTACVPEGREEDADWATGCATLAAAARPHYNSSIEALGIHDVPGALEAAEAALRCAPFVPHLLDYTLALSVQQGDYDLARRALGTARALDLDGLTETYEAELADRISRWNAEIAEPERMRRRVEADADPPSYRDLLFLSQATGTVGPVIQNHLRTFGLALPTAPVVPPPVRDNPVPTGRRRAWTRAALPAALVLGLGAGWLLPRGEGPGDRRSVAPLPADTGAPTRGNERSTLDRAARSLTAGDAGAALALLHRVRGSTADTTDAALTRVLTQVATARLIDEARTHWRVGDYAGVVERLRPLADVDSLTESDGLYWLGVSAQRTGDGALALQAFRRYLSHAASVRSPHYRAQAAYSAATLAQGAEAKPFARIIADEFAGTVYYNSTIRQLVR